MDQIPYNRRAVSEELSTESSAGPVAALIGLGALMTAALIVGSMLLYGPPGGNLEDASWPPAVEVATGLTALPSPEKDAGDVGSGMKGTAPPGRADEPDELYAPDRSEPASDEQDDMDATILSKHPREDQVERRRSSPKTSPPQRASWRQREPDPERYTPEPEWDPYAYADRNDEYVENREYTVNPLYTENDMNTENCESAGWERRREVRIIVRRSPDEPVRRRVIVVRRTLEEPFDRGPVRAPDWESVREHDRVVILRRSPCGPAEPVDMMPPPSVRHRYREAGDW